MTFISALVHAFHTIRNRLTGAGASGGSRPWLDERRSGTASSQDPLPTYRVLVLASAPEDRDQLRDFCAQLGWTVVFRDRFAGWRSARREKVSVIFAMAESLSDPKIEALRRASASPDAGRLRPPVIYLAPLGATVQDVRTVGAFFEHVEMRPLFFSTFKLLVVRATSGQFSRWPALPGASQEPSPPGRPGGDDTGGR